MQEFRLTGNSDGRFDWVAGAMYSEVETEEANFQFILLGLQDFVEATAGPGIVSDDRLVAGPFDVTSTEYAFYADVGVQLNDQCSAYIFYCQ